MKNSKRTYIFIIGLILSPSLLYFFDDTGSIYKKYIEPIVVNGLKYGNRSYDDISLYKDSYQKCIEKGQDGSIYGEFLNKAKLAQQKVSSATGEQLEVALEKLTQLGHTKESYIEENNRSIIKFQSLYDQEMDNVRKNCQQYSIEGLSSEANIFYIVLILMGFVGLLIVGIEDGIYLIRNSQRI